MQMNLEKLEDKVRNKLNITWDDVETKSRVKDMIEDSINILNFKIGCFDIDYVKPGIERTLFLNYCLYSWNNCVNEFDKDYMNEIYQARAKYGVSKNEKEEI